MTYGILMFTFQIPSRRKANKQMTQPTFKNNLRLVFPELEDLPHADTLFRLLCVIDVDQIEDSLANLINRLIKKKKFKRFLINNCYPIAIDGTQKVAFNERWCEQLLQRKRKKSEKDEAVAGSNENTIEEPDDNTYRPSDYKYSIYVLEATLSFHNGMVLPLLSEFLVFEKGDMKNNKQDCEQRAFNRITERLKKLFPRLPIILLLDGLYANGPIMKQCHEKNWQFMIVLIDDSLPYTWDTFHDELKIRPNNSMRNSWGIRWQSFNWVNGITHSFKNKENNNETEEMTIHVITCHEEWKEVSNDAEIVTKKAKHAWISSQPLNLKNIHDRCNLGARSRWGIETIFLVEKHQGYSYEHCFGRDWSAVKGYHYLMRLAHVFNTLARFSKALSDYYKEYGVRGFITFVYSTFCGPWFDTGDVETRLLQPFHLSWK